MASQLERKTKMTQMTDISGSAALAICESLLLALNDRNVLPEHEIMGVLKDAASTHSLWPAADGNVKFHTAVAKLINDIIAGGNSVRRP